MRACIRHGSNFQQSFELVILFSNWIKYFWDTLVLKISFFFQKVIFGLRHWCFGCVYNNDLYAWKLYRTGQVNGQQPGSSWEGGDSWVLLMMSLEYRSGWSWTVANASAVRACWPRPIWRTSLIEAICPENTPLFSLNDMAFQVVSPSKLGAQRFGWYGCLWLWTSVFCSSRYIGQLLSQTPRKTHKTPILHVWGRHGVLTWHMRHVRPPENAPGSCASCMACCTMNGRKCWIGRRF